MARSPAIGGVPPIGHRSPVTVFVDEDLLAFGEAWAAAGTPYAVFKLPGNLTTILAEHADPVAKVTILPAGQSLGVTEQLPLVERHLYGEDYLHDTLSVMLGGRASELVVLGQGSTGAANDLAKATDLATRMVREFGLSKALGPVGYPSGGSVFLGEGGPRFSSRPFAERTQAEIDAEVSRLLTEAERRAVATLEEHRDVLDRLVELLLARETVDGAEVYALTGRPAPKSTGTSVTVGPARTGAVARAEALPPDGASPDAEAAPSPGTPPPAQRGR